MPLQVILTFTQFLKLNPGILCMAIVGGAIVPVLQGLLADNIGIHHAFILPVLCYWYIAYYGFKGSVPSFEKAELALEEA